MTTDADARYRKRTRIQHTGWHAGFASIVIDHKTGKVLDEENADALRHPASLTKIMTLYLLFERIEAGKLKLDSRLKVSAFASAQPPSKLGLAPNSTIEVEDAIKALVTRSANDVAVTIAEALADDQEDFAELMTKKARALGMSKTTFKNASGLPHRDQVTTARDMATLGRAVQDRFPRLYRFFSVQQFHWRGRRIGNHNRLLGRVEGVDGIKTGYTNASGFNLVTNVKTDNRHVVAVVLGGRTGSQRDAHMRELIDDYLEEATTGKRTAALVIEAPQTPIVRTAASPPPARRRVAAARVIPSPLPRQVQVAGSSEPIRPIPVRTQPFGADGQLKAPTVANAGVLGTLSMSNYSAVGATPVQMTPGFTNPQIATAQLQPPPSAQTVVENESPAENEPLIASTEEPENDGELPAAFAITTAPASANPSPATPAPQAPATTAATPDVTPAPPAAATPVSPPAARRVQVATASSIPTSAAAPEPDAIPAVARTGWSIQIGAYPDLGQAKERLDEARTTAKTILAKATPYTEKISKGSTNLFRARFAGFNEAAARNACKALQRNDFDCMALKN